MGLSAETWVSESEVEEALDITHGSMTAKLQNLINRATQIVQSYIGYKVVSASYTEYYDGTGTKQLVLNNNNVTAITSIAYRNTDFYTTWTTFLSTDYTFRANGIVDFVSCFLDRKQHYRVIYTAGWASASVPEDLDQAVIDVVAYLLNQSKATGLKSERLGEYSYVKDDRSLFESGVLSVLEPYRLPNIG